MYYYRHATLPPLPDTQPPTGRPPRHHQIYFGFQPTVKWSITFVPVQFAGQSYVLWWKYQGELSSASPQSCLGQDDIYRSWQELPGKHYHPVDNCEAEAPWDYHYDTISPHKTLTRLKLKRNLTWKYFLFPGDFQYWSRL